jgi:hypothetical protein
MTTKKASVKKATKKAVAKKATEKPKPKVETPSEVVPKAVVEDTAHSISVAEAEKIAESRVTHDDERPPTTLDVPELFSRAWDAVKGASDPLLSECAPSHVDKFYSHGQRILAGNSPQEGDTQLARFEQKVFELKKVRRN